MSLAGGSPCWTVLSPGLLLEGKVTPTFFAPAHCTSPAAALVPDSGKPWYIGLALNRTPCHRPVPALSALTFSTERTRVIQKDPRPVGDQKAFKQVGLSSSLTYRRQVSTEPSASPQLCQHPHLQKPKNLHCIFCAEESASVGQSSSGETEVLLQMGTGCGDSALPSASQQYTHPNPDTPPLCRTLDD